MSVADKALWVMERNITEALSLNSIAEACGVSRSHLANAFGTASGWPVMRYLKARRLSEAARQLAGGSTEILALALEFGYGSHEAFTRAFRDWFGVTPEEVRKRRSLDGLDLTDPLRLGAAPVRPPVPKLCRLGRLRLVGLSAPCSFAATSRIPAQWQAFVANHHEAIPDKARRMPIGVCRAPDDEGTFEYMCAVEVTSAPFPRPPLTSLDIAPGTYAVFDHRRHVSSIFDTYRAIWNEALPALARTVADGPVLEFHNEAFDPDTGEGGLTIWVPLKEDAGGPQ